MITLEAKSAFSVDETGLVTGTAWDFRTPDRIRDRITKGAFDGAQMPVPMLFSHDPSDVIGSWDSITETDTGLEVRGKLLVGQVRRADEVRSMILAGAARGLSVGFSIKSSTGTKGRDRVISAVDLVEISVVSVPAHPRARITEAKRLDPAASAIRLAAAISRASAALRTI